MNWFVVIFLAVVLGLVRTIYGLDVQEHTSQSMNQPFECNNLLSWVVVGYLTKGTRGPNDNSVAVKSLDLLPFVGWQDVLINEKNGRILLNIGSDYTSVHLERTAYWFCLFLPELIRRHTCTFRNSVHHLERTNSLLILFLFTETY